MQTKSTVLAPLRGAALAGALLASPGIAFAQPPNLEGVWSGVFTTQEHEYWSVEDFACFAGCPPEGYEYLQSLLDDPANDAKPFEALMGQTFGYMRESMTKKLTPAGLRVQQSVTDANDPGQLCEPYGFARQVTNALPIWIREEDDNLVIQYEEWSKTRTIFLDGRSHPADLTPSPYGHSVGRWEGDTLVVDTVGLSPDIFYTFQTGGGYSEQARATERYRVEENPRRLVLELTLEDPTMLLEPFVTVKTWLYMPDLKLVEDSCGDFPARP
jgi:hypothetical protein